MRRVGVGALGLVVAAVAGAAFAEGAAPPAEEHVRGVIVSRSGDALEVKSRTGGTVSLKLAGDLRVTQVEKADLGQIGKGEFIGTTTVPQPDGSLRAVEVHVFPESMRGTGEGQRPWDLGGSKSTMTNATVAGIQQKGGQGGTMTNATVAEKKKHGAGETLALEYKGGKATVLVPQGTPVVKIEPGDRSQLVQKAKIFAGVSRGQDGALVAHRIVVGKDVAPPM
jgi:hypothetical protein